MMEYPAIINRRDATSINESFEDKHFVAAYLNEVNAIMLSERVNDSNCVGILVHEQVHWLFHSFMRPSHESFREDVAILAAVMGAPYPIDERYAQWLGWPAISVPEPPVAEQHGSSGRAPEGSGGR